MPERAARLDTAGAGEAVVCQLSNGSCLRMSPSAYWLFTALQGGRSPEEIAQEIQRKFGQQISVDQVAAACADLVVRVRKESSGVAKAMRRRYVFRIRLLPEAVVGRIGAGLTFLFSPAAVAIWACWLCASVILVAVVGPGAAGTLNLGTSFIGAYLIYLAALVAHEFGHAAACARYRIRPGDIGFAVYLMFPAVYCDVTRAWLLPRRQRLVVDVAGMAFEVGAGACYAIAGILLHLPVLMLAALMVLGNLLMTLSPFGRFDSYWVLSDALGVADLSRQSWRVLRETFGARGGERRSSDVAYSGFRRRVILLYAVFMVLIFGWFSYTLAQVGEPLAIHLAEAAATIAREGDQGRFNRALHGLAGIAPSLLAAGVVAYRLGMILRPIAAKGTAILRRPADRPRAGNAGPGHADQRDGGQASANGAPHRQRPSSAGPLPGAAVQEADVTAVSP